MNPRHKMESLLPVIDPVVGRLPTSPRRTKGRFWWETSEKDSLYFIDSKTHTLSFVSEIIRLLTISVRWLLWCDCRSPCVCKRSENLPFVTSGKIQKVPELKPAEWAFLRQQWWFCEETAVLPVFLRAQRVMNTDREGTELKSNLEWNSGGKTFWKYLKQFSSFLFSCFVYSGVIYNFKNFMSRSQRASYLNINSKG